MGSGLWISVAAGVYENSARSVHTIPGMTLSLASSQSARCIRIASGRFHPTHLRAAGQKPLPLFAWIAPEATRKRCCPVKPSTAPFFPFALGDDVISSCACRWTQMPQRKVLMRPSPLSRPFEISRRITEVDVRACDHSGPPFAPFAVKEKSFNRQGR